MAKIQVVCPSTGWVHKELATKLIEIQADPRGHQLQFYFPVGATGPDDVRNRAAREFLKTPADYMLTVDADNPPVGNPLELVRFDLDVVACPTPIWKSYGYEVARPPIVWNAFRDHSRGGYQDIEHRSSDLEEVGAAGTGAMLISRRVLEHKRMRWPFCRRYDSDGVPEIGSDLAFCSRARDAGFRVHVAWDYPCRHFKEVELLSVRQIMNWRDIRWANRQDVNTAAYWDREWSTRPERKLPFYPEIARRVAGQSVLDFGCGRGDLLEELVQTASRAEGVDKAPESVRKCRERGFSATIGHRVPCGRWDVIVATEVLEHLEDDRATLQDFFRHADRVIYSVPNNCMPPGQEKEHRRVYTADYCEAITPHVRSIEEWGIYLLVEARKE